MARTRRAAVLHPLLASLLALCLLQGAASQGSGLGNARRAHSARRRHVGLVHSILADGDDAGDDADVEAPAVRTASHERKLDPANFLVVIIAALILWYTADRALNPPYMDFEKMSDREKSEYNEVLEAGEMHLSTTLIFVVVASCSLVLIFFFMSALHVLLNVIFSFVALVALSAFVYPYVDKLTDRRFSEEIEIPWLGPMPQLVFWIAPFTAVVVFLWLVTKSWLLNNLLAFALVVFFLTTIRLSSLMVAASLLILAFFYDIFWVFCSSELFGKNVMVSVATGLDIPIKILVPLVLGGSGGDEFTLIGLGDIVLPGLLVCFAMRFDDHKGVPSHAGYFAWTLGGYIVGLTICEVVVGTWHIAQPAMIYLVPGTLIPMAILALTRGELTEIWNGIGTQSHERIVEKDAVDATQV